LNPFAYRRGGRSSWQGKRGKEGGVFIGGSGETEGASSIRGRKKGYSGDLLQGRGKKKGQNSSSSPLKIRGSNQGQE